MSALGMGAPATPLICPACAGELQVGLVEEHRQYFCARCGGTVATISVLHQVAKQKAQALWTSEPVPGPGQDRNCPFCMRPMQERKVDVGQAAVCRPCEAVWLDKQANEAMHSAAAAGPVTPSDELLRCPQCGAPVANSWDEHCRYCGNTLHAPTQVVLFPVDTEGQPVPPRKGLLGQLLRDVNEL